MNADTRERIERLRSVDAMDDTYDVVSVFMNGSKLGAFSTDKLIHDLIDLLERSDPDWWTDERLRECGLVRLPRDKDGEVISVGDVVWSVESGEQMMVTQILNGGSEGTAIRAIEHDYSIVYAPCDVTHHPPVTVESVLREFGDKYIQVVESPNPIVGFSNEIIGEEDPEKTIAEYAKRLRLAKEDE